ncbi:MAG: PEP-CTERM sorting domain-containing protein, partial [Anaerohalosphaeraceae bacterium]
TGAGEWTATLFYDDPANVIGSYVQGMASWFPDLVWYSDTTGIASTPETVGGTLGILMTSSGTGISQFDELTVNVIPEPATMALLALGGLLLRRKK